MMKKKTLLITMVLTIVMSTSVFAAGGDNYGEDIFGTTSSQVTTTKASATEKTTDKENIKKVKKCLQRLLLYDKIISVARAMAHRQMVRHWTLTPAFSRFESLWAS